jgi:hypothetical protein
LRKNQGEAFASPFVSLVSDVFHEFAILNHVMVEILRMTWASLEEADEYLVSDIKTNFPFYPLSRLDYIDDADEFQIGNFLSGNGEYSFVSHGGFSHGGFSDAFKIAYGCGK